MFGQTLHVFAPGLLSNDNDSDGGTMTVALVGDVSHGTLALGSDGGLDYTPAAGFSGIDNFSYRAVNPIGNGNRVNVAISVALPTTAQAPSGLYASALSGNRLTLRWTSSPVGLVPTDRDRGGHGARRWSARCGPAAAIRSSPSMRRAARCPRAGHLRREPQAMRRTRSSCSSTRRRYRRRQRT